MAIFASEVTILPVTIYILHQVVGFARNQFQFLQGASSSIHMSDMA